MSTITGDAELRRKLAKLKDLRSVVPAVTEAAIYVKGQIAQYPSPTFRNMPPVPYYIRGRGTQVSANRNLGNSEDLGQKWTIKGMKGGLQQIIGNIVSYGPKVQGPNQQPLFKQIGWKTTDEVMKNEDEKVLKQIKARVDIILRGG